MKFIIKMVILFRVIVVGWLVWIIIFFLKLLMVFIIIDGILEVWKIF